MYIVGYIETIEQFVIRQINYHPTLERIKKYCHRNSWEFCFTDQ
jgi:hypothetical protein